jgi:hypothetical protein
LRSPHPKPAKLPSSLAQVSASNGRCWHQLINLLPVSFAPRAVQETALGMSVRCHSGSCRDIAGHPDRVSGGN